MTYLKFILAGIVAIVAALVCWLGLLVLAHFIGWDKVGIGVVAVVIGLTLWKHEMSGKKHARR